MLTTTTLPAPARKTPLQLLRDVADKDGFFLSGEAINYLIKNGVKEGTARALPYAYSEATDTPTVRRMLDRARKPRSTRRPPRGSDELDGLFIGAVHDYVQGDASKVFSYTPVYRKSGMWALEFRRRLNRLATSAGTRSNWRLNDEGARLMRAYAALSDTAVRVPKLTATAAPPQRKTGRNGGIPPYAAWNMKRSTERKMWEGVEKIGLPEFAPRALREATGELWMNNVYRFLHQHAEKRSWGDWVIPAESIERGERILGRKLFPQPDANTPPVMVDLMETERFIPAPETEEDSRYAAVEESEPVASDTAHNTFDMKDGIRHQLDVITKTDPLDVNITMPDLTPLILLAALNGAFTLAGIVFMLKAAGVM